MSAAEVIEQIKKLPPEEKAKVVNFAISQSIHAPASGTDVGDDFKQTAQKVFATNADLFRKLAQ
jgi:hypothetical protein